MRHHHHHRRPFPQIWYVSILLFSGIDILKDYKVKLHIEKTVQPIAQSHRRIPFHIRKTVEAELKMLEDNDIIEKVDGPWVSPVVVVPKPHAPNKIRLCVDMRLPNQAIKRERHVTLTVDELIHDLSGSSVFSKLHLNAGYHQLELEHHHIFDPCLPTPIQVSKFGNIISYSTMLSVKHSKAFLVF